jgi:hypothetical protein
MNHGKLLRALPAMIGDFRQGAMSISAIASKAGVDPRTLRSALRDGEAATGGPLRELHLVELSTRSLRPWGSTSGPPGWSDARRACAHPGRLRAPT